MIVWITKALSVNTIKKYNLTRSHLLITKIHYLVKSVGHIEHKYFSLKQEKFIKIRGLYRVAYISPWDSVTDPGSQRSKRMPQNCPVEIADTKL